MNIEFSTKLNFQTAEVEDPHDVLIYSVVAQKSLLYLNLEGSESILQTRSIFTEEDCRKIIDPRRKILYEYHLDLSKGLEKSLRNINPENTPIVDRDDVYDGSDRTFYLKEIRAHESVYNCGLEYGILDAIMLADNQIEKLKKYLNVIKLLKFEKSCVDVTNFLYDHILEVLHSNSNDSDLVMKCVTMFDFAAWVFDRENSQILKYVLNHAQRTRRDLWRTFDWGEDPVNGCIYHLTFKNIGVLIQYGAPLKFLHEFYIKRFIPIEYPEERYFSYLSQKAQTRERMLLLFQLFYVYMHSRKAVRRLRYIWRAIPEPYLIKEEIMSVFDRAMIAMDLANNIAEYYISEVREESSLAMKVTPRTLKHLCRVAIRSCLNCNCHLPYGISKLPIPTILKSYLNIEF